MSSFTTPVSIEATGDFDCAGRPLYRLNHELVYEVGGEGSGLRIVIPEGRVSNLATVPVPRCRFLRWLLRYLYFEITDPRGKYIAAPILHDYLCNEEFPGIQMEKSGFSRFEADAIFRSSMTTLKAPTWQRLTAYAAVRASAWWQGLGG